MASLSVTILPGGPLHLKTFRRLGLSFAECHSQEKGILAMPIQIDDSNPPISSSELEALENKLGIRLPDEYHRFILAHNGGTPTLNIFHFEGENGPYTDSQVHYFFSNTF
jgi:hypothetical protein